MKYILFEKSAVERLVSKTEFQSIEFPSGMDLINTICGKIQPETLGSVHVKYEKDKGVLFVGSNCTKNILLFDLTQCMLLQEQNNPDSLLLVLQKVFRTAIRFWNHQPFTSSERINGTKTIIFPFVFTDHRRVVLERAPKCDRLTKRGIDRPLLVYKYNAEDAPRGEEIPDVSILREAGETYLTLIPNLIKYFSEKNTSSGTEQNSQKPLLHETVNTHVADGGFMYQTYEQQLARLTSKQRAVVESKNTTSPIRIDGPAGTGKTASMILRAYRLLLDAKKDNKPYSIIFFAHSESTKGEIKRAFSTLSNAEEFLSKEYPQQIEFTTLLSYCVATTKIKASQLIERDACDAKQSQRILIEDALDEVCYSKYKTYKPLLSKALIDLLDSEITHRSHLLSMLQHEFSIQIKGRTNGTIEEYYKISRINNALPVETDKDKEFVFSIFLAYQNMLKVSAVYDSDDITVQALAQWNAPIWRRERADSGYDYIFVDEMHLFNVNEQHAFHFLTKSAEQKDIPICFALDYSQAIGDRGNTQLDYIETAFGDAERKKYKTVFRSSQQITDFCAAISASGALMFQGDYKDPYDIPSSGFTQQEDAWCTPPRLFMYDNELDMFSSLKTHIDRVKQDMQCKNYDIAIVPFDESLLTPEKQEELSKLLGKKTSILKDRYTMSLSREAKQQDCIIVADPYSINGLEFKCVILYGVDEGRVPQSNGVNDISANYIKYIAFNQLYLAASRAKYQLILLGNNLHGISTCLQYALESKKIEKV